MSKIKASEEEKANKALSQLPEKVRGFYEAHYQVVGSLPEGTFVGLVCRVCNYWTEAGHEDDCPVKQLEAI
jgi:rubrerythrin